MGTLKSPCVHHNWSIMRTASSMPTFRCPASQFLFLGKWRRKWFLEENNRHAHDIKTFSPFHKHWITRSNGLPSYITHVWKKTTTEANLITSVKDDWRTMLRSIGLYQVLQRSEGKSRDQKKMQQNTIIEKFSLISISSKKDAHVQFSLEWSKFQIKPQFFFYFVFVYSIAFVNLVRHYVINLCPLFYQLSPSWSSTFHTDFH